MGAWASLKSPGVISSVWAACLRDLGISPSNCDVALAGSCLGKDREREVEKGLVERGRSMKGKHSQTGSLGEQKRWWYSIHSTCPALTLSSLSHPPLAPLA